MRTSFLIACALAASVRADCSTLESESESSGLAVAYNYNKGGDDWGELTHVPVIGEPEVVAFPTCKEGTSQSPIDLKSGEVKENLEINAFGF